MESFRSRRDFLKKTVLGCAATAAVSKTGLPVLSMQASENQDTNRIKIGCTSWAFHGFGQAESPVESIDILGEMGFDGIELIINSPEDITQFWTDNQIGKIRKQLDKYGMKVSQLAMFQPVVEDLSSLDSDKRNTAIDHFEAGTVIAKKLGALLVNIVAPWPRELSRPGGGYLPRYYDIPDPEQNQKFELILDQTFDWDDIWAHYVDTTRQCLQRVKIHGMQFSIEHHTHCLVSDANSFLLLWNEIRDNDLGYNLDVGWTQSQREYPPVAIHKIKDHLFNLHMRDIDGMMRRFIHIGEGVMDFEGIITALKKIGFSGYVSLEQDKFPGDMKETCKRYLSAIRNLLT